MNPAGVTRRHFVLRTSAGVAGMAMWSGTDAVRVGILGLGPQGRRHLRAMLQVPGLEVVALSDVDPGRLSAASCSLRTARRARPKACRDYRAVLDDPSVDAVAVVTPDHWHAAMIAASGDAGKAAWVDGPLFLDREGYAAVSSALAQFRRLVWPAAPMSPLEGITTRGGSAGQVDMVLVEPAWPLADPPLSSNANLRMWAGPARVASVPSSLRRGGWRWNWKTGLGSLGGGLLPALAGLGICQAASTVLCMGRSRQAGEAPREVEALVRFRSGSPYDVLRFLVRPGASTEPIAGSVRVARPGRSMTIPIGDSGSASDSHASWVAFCEAVREARAQPPGRLEAMVGANLVAVAAAEAYRTGAVALVHAAAPIPAGKENA